MGWEDVFNESGRMVLSRAELLAEGATGRSLTAAVKGRLLTRAMRDHYVLPGVARAVEYAIRVGGKLTCVSALETYGVFVFDSSSVHIHLAREASRLRSPRLREVPLRPDNRSAVTLHWWPLGREEGAEAHRVSVVDALAHVIRCQPRALAIATLDSALHLGLLSRFEFEDIFDLVPKRYRSLRSDVDGRSESGQESVLRLLMVDAGLKVEIQPIIQDVGRVDMIVEGRLVLEADSRLAHDGWEHHLHDRWRDVQAAKHGYMSLRPAYQHTMFQPDQVRAAALALLRGRRA